MWTKGENLKWEDMFPGGRNGQLSHAAEKDVGQDAYTEP